MAASLTETAVGSVIVVVYFTHGDRRTDSGYPPGLRLSSKPFLTSAPRQSYPTMSACRNSKFDSPHQWLQASFGSCSAPCHKAT